MVVYAIVGVDDSFTSLFVVFDSFSTILFHVFQCIYMLENKHKCVGMDGA